MSLLFTILSLQHLDGLTILLGHNIHIKDVIKKQLTNLIALIAVHRVVQKQQATTKCIVTVIYYGFKRFNALYEPVQT